MTRSLWFRLALLLCATALLPLVAAGAMSIHLARRTAIREVTRGNRDVARRAAAQLRQHVEKYVDMLHGLGQALAETTRVTPDQAESILKNYVLDVRDFRTADVVAADGTEIATCRLDGKVRDRRDDPAFKTAIAGAVYRSDVFLTKELEPQITLAVPIHDGGRVEAVVIANINLTEMWRMLARIRVGEHGFARVVGGDGTLIGHGDARARLHVFMREKEPRTAAVAAVLAGREMVGVYRTAGGEEVLGAAVPIPELRWGVLLEQPTSEAYALARALSINLVALVIVAVMLSLLVGFLGGRAFVRPVAALIAHTRDVARGKLAGRVVPRGPRELRELAEALNQMTHDLGRLHEEMKERERMATLGLLAAGLSHDLKHPINTIRSNVQLLLARPTDAEVRSTFGDMMDRELRRVDAYLTDLRAVARNEPLEGVRIPIAVGDFLRAFAAEFAPKVPATVRLETAPEAGDAVVAADRLQLARVLSNLVQNALDSLRARGGTVTLSSSATAGEVRLEVTDDGPGIPEGRLPGLFRTFESTKRRGLGIGLPISKKIIEDHAGRIEVESGAGRTVFRVVLPRAAAAEDTSSAG